MNKSVTQKSIIQMTQFAVLAVIPVVLVVFVRIPLIPAAPSLVYDMADTPILIAVLLFGSSLALLTLLVVSAIQTVFFGGDGWVGLVMHSAVFGALIFLVGEFYKRRHKFSDAVVGMMFSTLVMTALIISTNCISTVHLSGMPKATLDALTLPTIISLNLLKAFFNSVIVAVSFRSLQPFVQKNREMIYPIQQLSFRSLFCILHMTCYNNLITDAGALFLVPERCWFTTE